ncbi:hypothetical protein ACFGVR_19170 [Mucilaginibacter sp. AW1-3]
MKNQAEKRPATNDSASANAAQRVGSGAANHQPVGVNDHARQLQAYQNMVDDSPRIKQLKSYQNIADKGVKQFKTKTKNNTVSSAPVIQRWEWPSWVPWAKKKDPYEGLDAGQRHLAHITEGADRDERAERALIDHGQHTGRYGRSNVSLLENYQNAVHGSTSSPLHQTAAEKTGQVGSGASFIGGQTTNLSHLIGDEGLGAGGEWTKVGGQGLGVVGSVAKAALGIHDIATSQDQKKDKAIKGVDVVSSLGSAVQTGANGLGTLSGAIPASGALSTAASIAAPVIAPAAIVKSGADVVTGLATGGLAHYRSNKLQELGQQAMEKESIIKFAMDNQWTKAKANYAKAAGGALGVAGGALLLAAGLSNPVGWGLLAAAGGVALGVALYKMYKKHQSGNALLEERGSLRNDNIVVPQHVGRRGIGDYFKTEAMRRHDNVRGQIATNLAQSEGTSPYDDGPNTASKIVSNLGVGEKKKPDEESDLISALDADATEKARHERAKAIAKGLDI